MLFSLPREACIHPKFSPSLLNILERREHNEKFIYSLFSPHTPLRKWGKERRVRVYILLSIYDELED